MPLFVFTNGLVEEVGAPVCQTADYTAVGEDKRSGRSSDPEEGTKVSMGRRRQFGGRTGMGREYSLTSLVVCGLPTRTWTGQQYPCIIGWRLRTTAIISYNMAPSSYLHCSQFLVR